jgi:hypothetical protein
MTLLRRLPHGRLGHVSKTTMKHYIIAAATLSLLIGIAPRATAQQDTEREKLAQTGMKFLSISADPRAAGMGSAMTAMEGGAAMLFYNPAGMARLGTTADLMLGQTGWIADIDYNFGSFAFRPFGGRLGVIGVSLAFADYGDLEETVRADNEQGFLELGTFSPQAWSVGVGYARAITDRFSVGGQVKYATLDLGSSVMGVEGNGSVTDDGVVLARKDNEQGTMAFDFGVLYNTGFRSLNFAVSARNFAPEVTFEEESFQLPLTLQIGVAMDVLDLTPYGASNMHSLIVSLDAENPRDFSEQIKIGGEYTFLDAFVLRAGYVFPTDEEGISLGAGVRQEIAGIGFGADYAYTDFGVFSGVQRIALRLSF